MEDSYSEGDVSLSPSQILERLQVLRQLQLMQRGKLQKQRLQYKDSSENSNITEIVSHFSNSTSYNTFRSLLHSTDDVSYEELLPNHIEKLSPKLKEKDLIDGVSVLNLSRESEFVVKSPISTHSSDSQMKVDNVKISQVSLQSNSENMQSLQRKHITLEEMPILSPKKDFEGLLLEKLQNDNISSNNKNQTVKPKQQMQQTRKPFLKRGEGTARFGLRKNDFKIQNTHSLPWRRKNFGSKNYQSPLKEIKNYQNNKKSNIQKIQDVPQNVCTDEPASQIIDKSYYSVNIESKVECNNANKEVLNAEKFNGLENYVHDIKMNAIEMPKRKHPLAENKNKTWASVLTNEQNDFLQQLKQSEFYKNFGSPAKSSITAISCDESLRNINQQRETAEQNMFELLENKVSHESFNLENSFICKFLKNRNLESSGESTPLVMQKWIMENPNLCHIPMGLNQQEEDNTNTQINVNISRSHECTDCSTDTCSTISTCCSCKSTEKMDETLIETPVQKIQKVKSKMKEVGRQKEDNCDINDTEQNIMKSHLVEMNAKLVNTSELLKERLQELESEIETFRRENSNITKIKEEMDAERNKFYQEKATFEQKFNEEKILSEYYLAEEKEKLTKQKQIYERYVREIRGRLSKKERDEVINLKKEIECLKDEIRIKDAKSTSTIARLRNQIKILEKDKKEQQNEIEKLKKENKRIQHSNDITRRLSNMKYLAEINKKLNSMNSKNVQSETNIDTDSKYKAYEIEKQSRIRNIPLSKTNTITTKTRQRAKSVPNLNVTSSYAKYFSQRDVISQTEQNKSLDMERSDISNSDGDDLDTLEDNLPLGIPHLCDNKEGSDNEEVNNLEHIYLQTFRSNYPKTNRSSSSSVDSNCNIQEKRNISGFFLTKSNSTSNSVRNSKSPERNTITEKYINRSKSPISILSNRISDTSHCSPESLSEFSRMNESQNITKSPISTVLSNHSSLQSGTVIFNDKRINTEKPTTSSLSKTNLNPTEIKRSDGSRELRFPNGNVKHISADGKYSKFIYYNGDIKENFYSEGTIKYYYSETKTYHTTHADGLELLEFPDGQVEKRYKDGSSEIRLPNGSVRYFDPKSEHVREEWRFPDGAALTISASGEQRIMFSNGQIEVHATDHKRREFPDGTIKLVYHDGTSETRYASGRIRIKDKHGNLIMDSAPS